MNERFPEFEISEYPDDAVDQKKVDEYVRGEGLRCPRCKSDCVTGGDRDTNAGFVYQEVKCPDCGLAWQGIYKLVGICLDNGKEMFVKGDQHAD